MFATTMFNLPLAECSVGFDARDLNTPRNEWRRNIRQDHLDPDGLEQTILEDDLNLDGVHRREALTDHNGVTLWDAGADVDWTQHNFATRTAVDEEEASWVRLRGSRKASLGFEVSDEVEQSHSLTRSRRTRRILSIVRRAN